MLSEFKYLLFGVLAHWNACSVSIKRYVTHDLKDGVWMNHFCTYETDRRSQRKKTKFYRGFQVQQSSLFNIQSKLTLSLMTTT